MSACINLISFSQENHFEHKHAKQIEEEKHIFLEGERVRKCVMSVWVCVCVRGLCCAVLTAVNDGVT